MTIGTWKPLWKRLEIIAFGWAIGKLRGNNSEKGIVHDQLFQTFQPQPNGTEKSVLDYVNISRVRSKSLWPGSDLSSLAQSRQKFSCCRVLEMYVTLISLGFFFWGLPMYAVWPNYNLNYYMSSHVMQPKFFVGNLAIASFSFTHSTTKHS